MYFPDVPERNCELNYGCGMYLTHNWTGLFNHWIIKMPCQKFHVWKFGKYLDIFCSLVRMLHICKSFHRESDKCMFSLQVKKV